MGQANNEAPLAGNIALPGPQLLPKNDLARLVSAVQVEHDVIAPTYEPEDRGIALSRIDSFGQIATAFCDHQQPGHYTIERDPSGLLFGYNNGQESPKKFLHPARLRLFTGDLSADGGFTLQSEPGPSRPLAFFGLRPCDAFAVLVLDKTFLQNPNVDQPYLRRRKGSLLVVLNCIRPGNTCFCASMGTGPSAEVGYDIRLTELEGTFLLEAGSPAGSTVLARLGAPSADSGSIARASSLLHAAAGKMGRQLNNHNLPQILRQSLEHPHWDYMKTWCIGCTNCTIVCPTCFCNNTRDSIDLTFRHFARERLWDSCFSRQFAEVCGGNPRAELKHRYRHWAVHKLGYWVEQYGVSGCVGCGRCLTWCPVGIDITEVATVIRGSQA